MDSFTLSMLASQVDVGDGPLQVSLGPADEATVVEGIGVLGVEADRWAVVGHGLALRQVVVASPPIRQTWYAPGVAERTTKGPRLGL